MTEIDKEFKEQIAWMFKQISLYWEYIDAAALFESLYVNKHKLKLQTFWKFIV
jgi:hypothetical protein